MAELKDSGARRDFGTGAVRDVAEGKGRCDLLPLHQVAALLDDEIIKCIADYEDSGSITSLQDAICLFSSMVFGSQYTAMLEAAKQYEDGARKYGTKIALNVSEAVETITQEINKCPNVLNAEIRFIAKECAGAAMKKIYDQEILNLCNNSATTATSGIKNTPNGLETTPESVLKIPLAERGTDTQSRSSSCVSADLQSKQAFYSYRNNIISAQSAEETLIQSGQYILTMTMIRDSQEAICVVAATTELECLKNLLELCKKQLHISSNLLQMNISIETDKIVFSRSGERNWQKGIPVHCYIDSGVRHYLKFRRGDTDEPHDRAFVWNMLGAIWTHENKPELIDLPFAGMNKPEAGNPATDTSAENKPFDWDAFKTEKIAVRCDTEGKAKAFVAECKSRFPSECRMWENDEVNWCSYKSETTYSIVGGEFLFADVESDRKEGYTIVDYPFNQRKEDRT